MNSKIKILLKSKSLNDSENKHPQWEQTLNMVEIKMNKCKRCGRKLTNLESIKLGYGKTCYRIVQLQKTKQPEIKSNSNQEIQFIKCEIKTLKRMFKNIQINGVKVEAIERIKKDEHRPERDANKGNMAGVITEMREMFNRVENVFDLLTPITPRETIELPPMMVT